MGTFFAWCCSRAVTAASSAFSVAATEQVTKATWLKIHFHFYMILSIVGIMLVSVIQRMKHSILGLPSGCGLRVYCRRALGPETAAAAADFAARFTKGPGGLLSWLCPAAPSQEALPLCGALATLAWHLAWLRAAGTKPRRREGHEPRK